MLKPEDFDFEAFSPRAVALFQCRYLEDAWQQKRLAMMFIQKLKLCQCVGRVISAQYAPSQRPSGATNLTTVTLAPHRSSEFEFTRRNQKLDSWVTTLPRYAQFIPAVGSNLCGSEHVLILHAAMLRMLYYATSCALHRPWAVHSKDQSNSGVGRRKESCAKMRHNATGITHILDNLNQLNLTQFLPQSGLTAILPAAVAHLSNSMSGDPAIRESSIYNFHHCLHILNCLKELYPAANAEYANLKAAIVSQSGNYYSDFFFQIVQSNFDAPTIFDSASDKSAFHSISDPLFFLSRR